MIALVILFELQLLCNTRLDIAQGNAATAAAGDVHSDGWPQNSLASGQEDGAQIGLMLTDKPSDPASTAVQQPPSPPGPLALMSPPILEHMDQDKQQVPHNVTAIGLGSADAAVEQQQESSQLARESIAGGSSEGASHRHVAVDTAAAFLGGMLLLGEPLMTRLTMTSRTKRLLQYCHQKARSYQQRP